MSSKWDAAFDLAEGINYVIEFVIFTLFIYEESLQIANRLILNAIALNNRSVLGEQMQVNFDFVMSWADDFFSKYGILALYGCNAYSAYWFTCMMTREWGQIFLTGNRLDYSFETLPVF